MLTKKIDQNGLSSYQKQRSKMPLSWWVVFSLFIFFHKIEFTLDFY